MPETIADEKPGTATASPETIPTMRRGRPPKTVPLPAPSTPVEARHVALKTPEILWVNREESEHLDTMIGKSFVRKIEGEAGESKKYFYRIMSACPAVPSVQSMNGMVPGPKQSLVTFSIQKFWRNKFSQKPDARGGAGEKINEAVVWVEREPTTGDFEIVNADANFMMDSHDFERLFKLDN